MPSPGQELSSIDFESMIGGPLTAVVHAQAQAAMSSVNFIKEVGFEKGSDDQKINEAETGKPIYVKFKYMKEVSPYVPAVYDDDDGTIITPAKEAGYQQQILEVPILTILPIPYLRIDETSIEFNAKINSVSYRKTDTNFKIDAETEAKAGWLWGSAKLKVSASYQKNTQQGNTVNRTYSLNIKVKAVQAEMPEGLEKILRILEDSIVSTPAPPPAPQPVQP